MEEVERALRMIENGTKGKKKAKKGKGKRTKKQVESSEDVMDNSAEHNSDVQGPLTPEILDGIEVGLAEQKS